MAPDPCFPRSPGRIKAALLNAGVSFPLDLFVDHPGDFYANQYVYGRTSRGAKRAHRFPQAVRLGDGVLCALLRREESPWVLRREDGRLALSHDGHDVCEVGLPERPPYFGCTLSDGRLSEDFIAVAGESTPGFFVYPDCHYFSAGVPCSFCSLRHTRKTAGKEMANEFPLALLGEATRLFQSTPWKDIPIISITTGTFPDADDGARRTAEVVKAVHDALWPPIPIHVLTMPPHSFPLLHTLREAGATSIAFNLEVFEPRVFEDACPGKARYYGRGKLLDALEAAVSIFGAHNVFCGFVWGLEAARTLLDGYRWCLERGISVSSNVFHADQGSVFALRAHPSEEEILALCRAQSTLYDEFPSARTIFPVSMRSTLDWEILRGDFR